MRRPGGTGLRTIDADLAIVGSGVAGLLCARETLARGRRVAIVERGAFKSHAESLEDGDVAADVPGARPTHETASGTEPYPWDYVYGVGGSTLHWTGVAPRFHANDFRMRSAYGVMTDWPLGLEQLEPFYLRAERALGVAGAPGGEGGSPLPPLAYSPMDELLASRLAPYAPLPQARPSQPIDGRPACCGSATCELCPVDARFSPLNGLGSVLSDRNLALITESAAARLVLDPSGGRVRALECLDARGRSFRLRASEYVIAAGGFETPGLLQRSGLDRPDVGRFLFDHEHVTLLVRLRQEVGAGRGASLSTGMSQMLLDGDFRSQRSAVLVTPYNPGERMDGAIAKALERGVSGRRLRQEVLESWRRTLPLDLLLEDIPQPERRLKLGQRKDPFGLPFVSVAYPQATAYEVAGRQAARTDILRRLAPLGVEDVEERPGPAGSHILGTCRIGGGDDGVVDGDLRHLDVENLSVAGGAVFPTYSPAHPTLTIAALAIRLGDRLAEAS